MNPTKNTADKIFLMRRIIGLELRLLRTEKKLTLSEAASQSGVSIKNIKLEKLFHYIKSPSSPPYMNMSCVLN